MRIVIDMQPAQSDSRYRGMGRYTISFMKELIRQATGHEIILVLNAKFRESIVDLKCEFKELQEKQIRIFDVPVGSNMKAPLRAAGDIMREQFLSSLKPDLVLITGLFDQTRTYHNISIGMHGSPWKTAVIHYDLIPFKNPTEYLTNEEHHAYYQGCLANLKKADVYFCISKYSKTELETSLSIPSEKVVDIGTATEPRPPLSKQEVTCAERIRKKLKISDYILYVPGGFDKRKNFERLIKAYGSLNFDLRSKYQLVIASKIPGMEIVTYYREIAKTIGLSSDRIIFTDYLTEMDLQFFYENASLFVFPSLHEGFGLPVLEAMNAGCPVIGSNCTSIPEVIGLEQALFDPYSVESIAQKMKQCLEDKVFSNSLVEHQKSQVQKFSWQKTVKRTLDWLSNPKIVSKNQDITKPVGIPLNSSIHHQQILQAFFKSAQRSPTPTELAFISNSLAFNQGSGRSKQMLIDVSAIVIEDSKTGIQRVVRSLLAQFMESPPPGCAICPVYFDEKIYRYTSKFSHSSPDISKKSHEIQDNDPVDFWQDDIFVSLDLTMHLWSLFDAVHLRMRQRGVKLYFIIYDLLPLKQPSWFMEPGPEMFHTWIKKITEHSDGLICISEAVALELRDWIEENPLKRNDGMPSISSFHLGADIENSRPSMGVPSAAKQLLPLFKQNKTFLMVSTLEPRKGHAQTLRAFEKLWQEGHEVFLVLVGKKGWKVDELTLSIEEHPMLNQNLFWLQGVSDEYLTQIYQSATCLIAASEGEGFGLPLIESAHHKIPIIARDLPVFKEVAQSHAYYFSTRKSENLARAIKEWLKLYETNSHPKSDGMPWLNWKQSAEQLMTQIVPDRHQ